MELTNKPQNDILYEKNEHKTSQAPAEENTHKKQTWWDAQCYPDAHESER